MRSGTRRARGKPRFEEEAFRIMLAVWPEEEMELRSVDWNPRIALPKVVSEDGDRQADTWCGRRN